MELRRYCEASHSLASWDLKGKETVDEMEQFDIHKAAHTEF